MCSCENIIDLGLTLSDCLSSDSKCNINSLSGYEDIETSTGALTVKAENSGTSIRRTSHVFPVYPTPSQSHLKVFSSVSMHIPLCLQGLG